MTPTMAGRICSFYYLQHTTLDLFCNHMARGMDFKRLLLILASAPEYDELPVRPSAQLAGGIDVAAGMALLLNLASAPELAKQLVGRCLLFTSRLDALLCLGQYNHTHAVSTLNGSAVVRCTILRACRCATTRRP